MGYKPVSLSHEAYRKLASLKRSGESFTDVVIRLCSNTKPLASFAGSWTMSDEEEKEIFGEISGLWKKYEESLLRNRFSNSTIEKTPRGH